MPPQNRSKVPIGTVLEGKYSITREIGRGGMAAVYEAENVVIGKRVAVKVLAAELITSRVVRERFIREARAAAAIRSPFICDVYDNGMFDERPFLVMELLEGESLYDMMTRLRRLDPATTVDITRMVARGLDKAHAASVVHRDLKPENIFLVRTEEGGQLAKILDFGLAKFYEPTGGDREQARLTREGALFGTPAYMSPEQAKGQGEVDHRADLWALGCIVFECLTGQTVWNVDQGVAMILAQIAGAPVPIPSRVRRDLPPAFDDWFLRAVDRSPERRFQSGKELADALALALLDGTEGTLGQSLSQAAVPRSMPGVGALDANAPRPAEVSGLIAPARPDPAPPAPPDAEPVSDERASMRRPLSSGIIDEGSSGPARPIAIIVAIAAVVLGGYATWLYVLHPPGELAAAPSASVSGSASAPAPSTSAPPRRSPLEREPYAVVLGKGQGQLASGELRTAIERFKAAYKDGGSGVAITLKEHASAADQAEKGPCRLTGVGRPRPYDQTDRTERPSIAMTKHGLVAAWIDAHVERTKRQAYTTLMDKALRRVSPAVNVTPESSFVEWLQLVESSETLATIFADRGSKKPGVYVRLLQADGTIAARSRRIGVTGRGRIFPTMTGAPDGTFWAFWESEVEPGTEDLLARHLDAKLQPIGRAVRLTAFAPAKGLRTAALTASATIHGKHLFVAFALNRWQRHRIHLLQIKLTDPDLQDGLPGLLPDGRSARSSAAASASASTTPPAASADPLARGADRVVGSIAAVSVENGQHFSPSLGCTKEGCFIVWDDERGGTQLAFHDGTTGEQLWRRDFSQKGTRPAIATTTEEAVVAWYEGNRVKIANLTRTGPGPESVLARVSGFQPLPSVLAGKKPGEWYVAWRDYEAGHLEAFVARATCQTR